MDWAEIPQQEWRMWKRILKPFSLVINIILPYKKEKILVHATKYGCGFLP